MSLRLILNVLSLDILDANYYHTSERLGRLHADFPLRARRNGILRSLARFLRGCLRRPAQLANSERGDVGPCDRNSGLAYVESLNEWNAIKPLLRLEDGATVVGNGPVSDSVAAPFLYARYPAIAAYWLSLPFIPFSVFHWCKASPYQRKSFRLVLDRLWLSYGGYIVWRQMLKRRRPRFVIVSNDHNLMSRLAIRAADDLGIPSAYIQHAGVTEAFPPLSVTIALLDGMDALTKYCAAGPTRTRAFLVGCARAERPSAERYRSSGSTHRQIGICVNLLDDLSDVESLLEEIGRSLAAEVAVRLHPRMRPAACQRIRETVARLGFKYSDSTLESPQDFLSMNTVTVAGDSGIHIEAAFAGSVPVLYHPDPRFHGRQGFVKNGLVQDHAFDPDGLVTILRKLLQNPPADVRNRTKWYCETIGTEWDGKSADLVRDLLSEPLESLQEPGLPWIRIDTSSIAAYRPSLYGTRTTGCDIYP